MNVTEDKALDLDCPVFSIGKKLPTKCKGSGCMWWQFDEAMFDGPDSYVADPGPTGHCGITKQEL